MTTIDESRSPEQGQRGDKAGAELLLRPAVQPFIMLPNRTILDARMSPGALGLLSYLLMRASTPGGWTFYTSEIVRHFDVGRGGVMVRNGLRELEELGYLERERVRGERGRLVGLRYTVSAESPAARTAQGMRAEAKTTVQERISTTSRFSTCGGASCGGPRTNKNDDNQTEGNKPHVVASDDGGVEQGTEGQRHPAPLNATKGGERKGKVSSAQYEAFRKAWNENRYTSPTWSWAAKSVLAEKDERGLKKIIDRYNGDVEQALEVWTLIVRYLARLAAQRRGGFWGSHDPDTRPAFANLLPNWGDWVNRAEDAAVRPARRAPSYGGALPTTSAGDSSKQVI